MLRHLAALAAVAFLHEALYLAQQPDQPEQQAQQQEQPVEIKEEVVVTATRTDTRLQDQPLRVEVIDRIVSARWSDQSRLTTAARDGARDPRQPHVAGRDGRDRLADPALSAGWGLRLLGGYHGQALKRRDVPLPPRHAGSLNAIWEDEGWGRIGVEAYYTGRQPLADNPYRSAGRAYWLIGLLAEWRIALGGCS